MNGVWIVMRREIVERRMALLAAFVAGLLAFLASLFFERGSSGHHEARAASALIAAAFGLGAALFFGGTVLVRDLAEKRLAFYFARPLSAFAIWSGKLVAAWALAFAGTVLVALPTCLVDGPERFFGDRIVAGLSLNVVLGAALTALVFVVLSHVGSSIARLRSPWLILDTLLLPTVLVGGWLALRPLLFSGFFAISSALALAGLFLVIPLVASFVQVAVGRTDAGRSHGALSATLWGLSIVAIAFSGALAIWVG